MADTRRWFWLGGVVLLCAFIWLLHPILTPFLVALLLAYLFDPLVDRLEKAILAARDEAKSASESLAHEIARSRSERATWELHRKIAEAAPIAPRPAPAARRLRKREAQSHA